MKRLIATIAACLISANIAVAQEKAAQQTAPPEAKPTDIRFVSRVFEIYNRDPRTIVTSLLLLGSGYKNAGINVNDELRTITVRDFPENVAAIEDAIKRLDRPATDPDVELKISVLIASGGPQAGPPPPNDMASVITQLRSALRYSTYTLVTTNVQRTKGGRGLESSGVVDATGPAGDKQPKQASYTYKIRNLTVTSGEKPSVNMETFSFSLRYFVPDSGNVNVSFETPVSVRDNQKVVIGTAAMGDKALIVVLSADIQ